MTTKEANSKALKLFNRWKKEFKGNQDPSNEYYEKLNEFKEECIKLSNVVGLYEVLSYKNALNMASICSSIRFEQPHVMLMNLQKTTKTY